MIIFFMTMEYGLIFDSEHCKFRSIMQECHGEDIRLIASFIIYSSYIYCYAIICILVPMLFQTETEVVKKLTGKNLGKYSSHNYVEKILLN